MASSQTGAERQAAFISGIFGGGGMFGGGGPQTAGASGTAKTRKKKPPTFDDDDPFAGRRARVWGMDKGKEKNVARRELRADITKQRETQQKNAFDPADWGDNDAYNPFGMNSSPNFDYGSFGFDSEHNYGNAANNYLQTEIGKNAIKQNPDAYYGYAQAMAGNPIDQTTAYGRYLGDQFNVLANKYATAQLVSPNLTWDKYLGGILPQQEAQYRSLPHQMRGDSPMVGGGATWIGGW